MFYCPYCGKSLPTDARFCERCGKSVEEEAVKARAAEEQTFLDHTYRFLKYERTAWRTVGIIYLVFAGLFWLFFALTIAGFDHLVFDSDSLSKLATLGSGLAALLLAFTAAALTPMAIINLIAAGKLKPYFYSLYADVRPTAKRCQSVGWIVFHFFFNPFALIFLGINFIRFKTEKETVRRIEQKQQAAM